MKLTKKIAKRRIKQIRWLHDEMLKKIKPRVANSVSYQTGLIIGFCEGRTKAYEEVLKGVI